MARRSLLERFEDLEGRRDDLEAAAIAKASPSPVHVQTIEVLSELLTMGKMFSTDKVPAPLRAMMRTLDLMKPTLLEELAEVPPEAIQAFMTDLMHKIERITSAPGAAPPANRKDPHP